MEGRKGARLKDRKVGRRYKRKDKRTKIRKDKRTEEGGVGGYGRMLEGWDGEE